MLAIFFVLMLLDSVEIAKAKEISCESIYDQGQWHLGTLKTCYVHGNSIDKMDVKFSNRENSAIGLWIHASSTTFYLPIGVAEKFQNLLAYAASECPIQDISRENFKGLIKLTELWLYDNQIEKIFSDTFMDMKALKYISLSKKFFL